MQILKSKDTHFHRQIANKIQVSKCEHACQQPLQIREYYLNGNVFCNKKKTKQELKSSEIKTHFRKFTFQTFIKLHTLKQKTNPLYVTA